MIYILKTIQRDTQVGNNEIKFPSVVPLLLE